MVPSLACSIIVREHGYFGVVETIAERDFAHHVLLLVAGWINDYVVFRIQPGYFRVDNRCGCAGCKRGWNDGRTKHG